MITPDSRDDGKTCSDETHALLESFAEAVNKEDVQEQEMVSLKLWQHMAETSDEEPSPWLRAMGEAHQREAVFDWVGAEHAYKRAIEATPEQPMLQSRALSQLSALYNLLDRDAQALEAAQAATAATRRDSIPSLLSLSLQAEARFYLKAGAFDRTWAAIDEAFAVQEDGPMHNLQRAYALALRADCCIQEGDMAKAKADLADAWELLQPHAATFFAAGSQSGLANWWAATAKLHEQQGELSEAVSAWREVVARRRIIAQLPQLEGPYKHNSLALALWDLGRVLRQAGDGLAPHSYRESRAIRQTIGLLPLEG